MKSEFDQHKDSYRSDIDKAVAFSGQSHDFFTRVKAGYLLELLRPLSAQAIGERGPGPLDVLDIGCGHGYIHPYLTRSDVPVRLSAVDVAEAVLDQARATNPTVRYDLYDGNKLPFADRSFDAVFAIAVMHHVPPPQWVEFVAEMRRVVRSGGLVAIFEHNPLNPLTQWIVRTCPIDDNAVLIGSRRLLRMLGQTGFVDSASRYILFTPFDGDRFRQFDKAIGWLPFGAQYFVTARVPAAM